jgi:malate dehydrogenase (oxaloacetate-decarboxylating)
MASPAIGYTLIMRLEMPPTPGAFGLLAQTIGDAGGIIGAVDMRNAGRLTTRDVTVTVASDSVANAVRASVERLDGVRIVSVSDSTFLAHLGGKIRIEPKIPVVNRTDLSKVYTPGVARVSMAIAGDPNKAFQLTIKRNSVAVVSDGTAVLGLGDIGPLAAAPVMEGKCMLFKQFAGIDAFPICLDTKDIDAIVETVVNIAPIFGGINLEDISAPRCFEVERRLQERLDIPVMHDDQHGTAVVILAALLNAAKVVHKDLDQLTVVVAGSGAAGRGSARRYRGRSRGRTQPLGPLRELALDVARRTHEQAKPQRLALRDAGGRRRLHRRLRAGHSAAARSAAHGPRPDRVRHGQPHARDHARRGGALRRGDGDRSLRFSQSGQ